MRGVRGLKENEMLETVVYAARQAGKVLREGCRSEIKVDRATNLDVKLQMDKKSEETILSILGKEFPNIPVLSEEAGRIGGEGEYMWVIDPLDGTMNYSRRIPCWATSIGLMRGGEEVLGVVYDPLLDELYTAEKGKGAFLNGQRIRVSDCTTLEKAIVGFGYSSVGDHIPRGMRATQRLGLKVSKFRNLGAAVLHLVFVASGRFDGFFEFGLHRWDCAAGFCIIREAGGLVSCRDTSDGCLEVAVSNGRLHDAILQELEW